jgi:hypothetical protein
MSDHCTSCKAEIRWAITAGGHPMPLDVDPVTDGNLRLDLDDRAEGMPRVVVVPPSSREPGEWLYVAHFRSCPFADQHRRRTQ